MLLFLLSDLFPSHRLRQFNLFGYFIPVSNYAAKYVHLLKESLTRLIRVVLLINVYFGL